MMHRVKPSSSGCNAVLPCKTAAVAPMIAIPREGVVTESRFTCHHTAPGILGEDSGG
jgi:hypothetical protein